MALLKYVVESPSCRITYARLLSVLDPVKVLVFGPAIPVAMASLSDKHSVVQVAGATEADMPFN